jgi:FO synthase
MQGGIDPELPGTAYLALAAAVKQRVPKMHVHALSPMEIVNGSSRTGLSFEDFLTRARESGLDTIPGTAAEMHVHSRSPRADCGRCARERVERSPSL